MRAKSIIDYTIEKNIIANDRVETSKIYEIYGSCPKIEETRSRSAVTAEEEASWAALRATGDPVV